MVSGCCLRICVGWGGRASNNNRWTKHSTGASKSLEGVQLRASRMKAVSPQVSGAVRTFAYFLSSGTHYMLPGVDYLSLYGEEPSAIEQTFAIFLNNLECDEEGNITNMKHAEKRATDYLRDYCITGAEVVPPLEYWEVQLYDLPRP